MFMPVSFMPKVESHWHQGRHTDYCLDPNSLRKEYENGGGAAVYPNKPNQAIIRVQRKQS